MHPMLARLPVLMEGAFQGAQAGTPPPPSVSLGATFATVTPDVAGGVQVVASFSVVRHGDLGGTVGFSVALTGSGANPLVAADVVGGLSDLAHQLDPGDVSLGLSVTFRAQDLGTDHAGTLTVHAVTGAALTGPASFDFALLHNQVVVVNGAWGSWDPKGQNSGMSWQVGAGDSGPYGGTDLAGEEHFAGRLAKPGGGNLAHLDIWTSFMVHDKVATVTSRFQSKKAALKGLADAGVRICQTIPLITDENVASIAAIISDATAAHPGQEYLGLRAMWRSIAQLFKDIGGLSPVFRMGHEMNGGHYPWGRITTAQYISLYRIVRTEMLSINSDIIFCWNPLRSQQKTQWWPGDAFVDIVGVDWYNNGGVGPTDTGYIHDQASWDAAYMWGTDAEPLGWGRWIAFAVAHGKMLCVPEWGCGHGSQQSASPSEDVPGYVALFKAFCKTQRAAGLFMFETYFNNAEHQLDPTATYVPNFATQYFGNWIKPSA